jgi:hypothetical protein
MVEVKCRSCTRVFISQDESTALRARDEHFEQDHRPEFVNWSQRTEEWKNLSEFDRDFLQKARIGV